MNAASKTEEETFMGILAILCLIIGTFLMISCVFFSGIPLIVGALVTLTGLIIFLMHNVFS
jgi:hypothetical protein